MAQRRRTSASLIASLAAAAALALPGAAMAAGYIHPANNEAGSTIHPSHFQSGKTRDQVRAEAAEAVRQGGSSRFNQGAYPAPAPQAGPGRTRQEVINELLQETPAQRDARQLAMGG
ncbi:DUF4148 domain-containing protein [Delftia sp. PS-11]|uniref:DUF4148 domain-containing protein n=1 Tax=Delftia sp. PS-11 TaxID=2767222 RepID=UPI002453EE0E|nr:DUF4148 domain-containing protein [Delftia sp. PS-11]KAJ8743484.1 DUF4148 domain-containing protein [Delftia sp. PS-11]